MSAVYVEESVSLRREASGRFHASSQWIFHDGSCTASEPAVEILDEATVDARVAELFAQ
ncbi:MAG: hypothetical protein L0K86_29905 [Actinomycetia bacterium]|nr:hypothetical protein [Actinomycetes bacterium]